MARAISSLRASINRRISYITLARLAGVVAAQAGKAAVAAATAAPTSDMPPAGTCAVCSPVAGLKTGLWPLPATLFPEMMWGTVFMPHSLARRRRFQSFGASPLGRPRGHHRRHRSRQSGPAASEQILTLQRCAFVSGLARRRTVARDIGLMAHDRRLAGDGGKDIGLVQRRFQVFLQRPQRPPVIRN